MADGPPLRVLVVDDVFDIRFLVRTRLAEDEQISVVGEAADPEEALRLAESLRPEAVVTDLFTSSAAYLTELRALLPRACILLCSAASRADDAVINGLAGGADGYLDKGEGFSRIGERLLELCQRKGGSS